MRGLHKGSCGLDLNWIQESAKQLDPLDRYTQYQDTVYTQYCYGAAVVYNEVEANLEEKEQSSCLSKIK